MKTESSLLWAMSTGMTQQVDELGQREGDYAYQKLTQDPRVREEQGPGLGMIGDITGWEQEPLSRSE